MEDLERAGGVFAVMKELTKKNLLDTSLITCTGKTIAENLEGVVNRNPELIRPIKNPYSADGGIAVLKGNLAPEGCVVKRSAVAPEMMLHTGPARVFNSEEEAITAILCARLRAVCLLSPLRPARLRAESLSCSAVMPPFPVHRQLPSAVQQPRPLLLPVRLQPWRKSPACSPLSRRRPCWTTPAWCW